MEYKYRHTGVVNEAGTKIKFNQQALYDRQLLFLAGKNIELYIREERKPASHAQFRFYVGVVLKEAHRHNQFIHYNQAIDIHEQVIAPKFLTEYKILDGSPRKTVKKLENLSEEEMWELTERVIAYLATEFRIEIKSKDNYYIK
jgi:hypothetical protein